MRAPDIHAVLETGERLPLRGLYSEQRLVLVFLRHLGCMFCRQQVAQLRVHHSLNVAFVVMANLEQALAFKAKMRSPHRFLCDPERELYQAFGLGLADRSQFFEAKTFGKGIGAMLKGHFAGLPIGDVRQLPGIFVIDPSGEVVWSFEGTEVWQVRNVDEIGG